MAVYGVAEAKNSFTQLLDRVAQGERVVVTRHGKPVAEIMPPSEDRQAPSAEKIAAAFERLRVMRESLPSADRPAVEIVRGMRDEGP